MSFWHATCVFIALIFYTCNHQLVLKISLSNCTYIHVYDVQVTASKEDPTLDAVDRELVTTSEFLDDYKIAAGALLDLRKVLNLQGDFSDIEKLATEVRNKCGCSDMLPARIAWFVASSTLVFKSQKFRLRVHFSVCVSLEIQSGMVNLQHIYGQGKLIILFKGLSCHKFM